jgi:hypothetical protein
MQRQRVSSATNGDGLEPTEDGCGGVICMPFQLCNQIEYLTRVGIYPGSPQRSQRSGGSHGG